MRRASNYSGPDQLCRHSEVLTSEPSVRSHLRKGSLLLLLHGFDRCCERPAGRTDRAFSFDVCGMGGADAHGEKIIARNGY